jgi:glyoxylase-like metal-dependent hydrolase (beta-lactamase superfamily II)
MTQVQMPEADLRLVRAANPSPLTGDGTNTFLIGRGQVCVLDPGPDDGAHLAAILAALGPDETIAAILVTHSHLDHSALAPRLAAHTGAPVWAFGDSKAGQSALMQDLAANALAGGGEGVDAAFRPDRTLRDTEVVTIGPEKITAIWTPGHMGNHLCFEWRGAVFSGDHVMGWATSLVSPPDGDLGAFMRSLTRLEQAKARVLYPAHGALVPDPAARIGDLRTHRQMREAQIVAELAHGPAQIADLVRAIYAETPVTLHKAAARNVYAHLIDLWERGTVHAVPRPTPEAQYSLTDMSRAKALL